MSSKAEEKHRNAEAENRLISVREGEIRVRVGYAILITLVLAYTFLPSIRDNYDPLSLVSAAGIGVWRTGKESL